VGGDGHQFKKIGANAVTFSVSTQTMHIRPIIHISIAMFSLKPYVYPGGNRTWIVCYGGKSDVHCATPPGLDISFLSSPLGTKFGHTHNIIEVSKVHTQE
jgi:hypothetical protein